MLRILYAGSFPPGFLAPAVRAAELSRALRDLGHTVTVLDLSQASRQDMSRALGFCDVVILREAGCRLWQLAWLARKARPVIAELHGIGVHEARRQGGRPWHLARAWARQGLSLALARIGVVSCPAYADALRRLYPVLRLSLEIVPNGVNLERFAAGDREGTRRKLGFVPTDTVLGFCGSFSSIYDFGPILRAARAHENVHLLLVGAGPGRTTLERQLLCSDRVRLLDPVPHREVPALLAATDLALLPLSTGHLEENRGVYSLKLGEILAAGKPLLTHDHSGTETWARLRPCSFAYERAEDAPAALARALEQREDWPAMGRAARALCPGWETVARAMEGLCTRLAPGRTVSRPPKTRPRVAVVAYSHIGHDARVSRQIRALSRAYQVVVLAFGPPPAWVAPDVLWQRLDPPAASQTPSPARKARPAQRFLAFQLARLYPPWYESLYWRDPKHTKVLSLLLEAGCDLIHANDWNTLPPCAQAARQTGARLVFDAHEYGPLEYAESLWFRLCESPMIAHLLRRYANQAELMLTVAPALAERYRREFGLEPRVVMNAPESRALPAEPSSEPGRIRLIHHGGAYRPRKLETMLQTLALCEPRFELSFMLLSSDAEYLAELREKAGSRVHFLDPVPPESVTAELARFDLGFCYMHPSNFNNLAGLPNKFFDYLSAGLAVFLGPSPSMAALAERYDCGLVASSFRPEEMAAALNALTPERLAQLRRGARRAALELNAEREMERMLEGYRELQD